MISALALLLVIGVGATSAIYPLGQLSAVGRCALSVALGYAVIGGTAFTLAAARSLTPLAFKVALTVIALGLWIAALLRHRATAGDRPRAKRDLSRMWPLVLGAGVVVAIALVRLTVSPLQDFGPPTAFRYWADGLEMASAGRVPAVTLQWGAVYAPTVSKVMLNSFEAGMTFFLGSQPLPAMGALTWISAVGFSLGVWWLGRELGLVRTAPLLILMLCANSFLGDPELTKDMAYFRAEVFGRMVAFCALALAVKAVRERNGYKDAIVSGVLLGVAATTHLVPSAVAAGMLLWYCAFVVMRDRTIASVATRVAATVVTALAVAESVLLFAGGNLAFGGAGGGGSYRAVGGADPTALFTTGLSLPFPAPRSHWLIPAHRLIDQYAGFTFGRSVAHPTLILAGLAIVTVVVIWRCPPGLKPAAVVAAGCAVNLIVVTLAFGYLYDVYVLATFGARRLGDYAALPVVIIVLVVVEWGLSAVPRRRLADSLSGVMVVAVAVVLLISLAPPAPAPRLGNTVGYLDWIRENTPCSARILSNRRTGGMYEALTGRAGVTEGMGPHLRPEILDQVIGLLERTHHFYQRPGREREFLRSEGIDYVVVFRHHPHVSNLRTFTANLPAFAALPFLRLAHANSQVLIYQVEGLTSAQPLPRPPDYPGYRCDRGPIQTAARGIRLPA
ncbi:MAG: hypothetical protein M3P01_05300 [Actinomycetota bacterium]|nr:hypothetical protein [Actinomycetota bacterium]